MKRSVSVCGFILIVFILLTVPSVPAVHYTIAVNSYKTKLIDSIKSIGIDDLQEKIKSIDNLKIQQELQNINFSALKEKIQNSNIDSGSPHFVFIYIILMHVLMSVLIGKPSLYRLFFNALCLQTFLAEIATGESAPQCNNFKSYAVAVIFFTFGALLFRMCQNKAIGFVLGIIMMYVGVFVQLAIINVLNSSS